MTEIDEVEQLRLAYEALAVLDHDARDRCLRWLTDRMTAERFTIASAAAPDPESVPCDGCRATGYARSWINGVEGESTCCRCNGTGRTAASTPECGRDEGAP